MAGAVLGAIVAGMVDDDNSNRRHTTPNYDYSDDYNGCHGMGCLVDDLDTD